MMKIGYLFLISVCLYAFLIQPVYALSPTDIVIVYNQNMAESKDVAQYYAQKRGVPHAQVIGVRVPKSEKISRAEFEKDMIPKIRSVVRMLKRSGKIPAILLVYGIPLSVKKVPGAKKDKEFEELIKKKVLEYKHLVLQLSIQIQDLIHENTIIHPDLDMRTCSTKDILTTANKSIFEASEFLTKSPPESKDSATIIKVASAFIRLTGISSVAEGIKKQLSEQHINQNDKMLKWNNILENQLTQTTFRGIFPENALETASVIRIVKGLIGELTFWDDLEELYTQDMTSASVDSELTLILCEAYQLSKWLPNPFLKIYDNMPGIQGIREKRVMVARVDGPTPKCAKRLIDDAMAIEKAGLRGIFYIDARGLSGNTFECSYAWYDEHLRNLYHILTQNSRMKIVMDNTPKLFPKKACPKAALYCGWYSLSNYIDSFEWMRGAVGFHVASSEAKTLKKRWSNCWCKRMIEEGVAATLGPVEEPYLTSFPLPDVFFPLLMSGKFSLLEVYFKSIPNLSWRQILIGDPLYTPFKNNPGIDSIG